MLAINVDLKEFGPEICRLVSYEYPHVMCNFGPPSAACPFNFTLCLFAFRTPEAVLIFDTVINYGKKVLSCSGAILRRNWELKKMAYICQAMKNWP